MDLRTTVAAPLRRRLRTGVERSPALRRTVTRVASALDGVLQDLPADPADEGVYGSSYFGAGRDPLDRMGLSGYERYDRATSNADVAAYLLWRTFDVQRTLDVGCAMGFVVEALRELHVEADGVELSPYAVERSAPGARPHVRQGDILQGLPDPDGAYDLVTTLEVLEHLPPESIPDAVAELRRLTRRWLVATVPSFGPNEHGPGGWYQVKVRDDRVAYYESLGPAFEGPIPHGDLYRDAAGAPIEGHLTIASFTWWTRRFEEAGFERCGEVERRLHPLLARFGMTKYWNLYVLRVPGTPVPPPDLRDPAACAEVEARWGLDRRTPDPEDERRVREALA
jgi:SAM-dependent methyltransferase